MPPLEKNICAEFGTDRCATPAATTAHSLVETSAASSPDAIAVVASGKRLSYSELNSRSNQLAHFLRAHVVGPEVVVGLLLRRTEELVVGLIGILKAGGAYLPLDPSYPSERLSLILKDSGAKILVTSADLAEVLPASDVQLVQVDADVLSIQKQSRENLDTTAEPHNLAYVIYTSGSTGRPKGVMVTHASLVNYLLWAADHYGPQARHSALVHSSISFDLTITGLLTPLVVGGRVELLAEDSAVDALLTALRGHGHHGLIKITPAHLELLNRQLRSDQLAGKVGLFVIGGENLDAEKLQVWRKFSPSTRLINEYGPTETVVGCCTYEVRANDPETGSVPIGRPIANTSLYILDQELRKVPAGDVGELYIGGAGVARGYLNLPELTEDRFRIDPFAREPGARMYRTGDLVRWREPGIFEYLGRLDEQVKLHGYRIEPGEIEAALVEHTAVRQSAAKVHIDELGNKRLVGYAVRRKNHSVSPEELREFLRRKLPHYMVPSSIVFLDALPLTLNGKVDRRALPAPNRECPQLKVEIIAPQNDVEAKLIAIFKEAFRTEIHLTDNFSDLGGDSFLAVELLLQIEQAFGIQLTIGTLFEVRSVSQLACVVENPAIPRSEIVPIQPAGSLPPFFCVNAGPLFKALANHLGTDRPFLGLTPMLPAMPSYKVEDIAVEAVRVIRAYQSEGPYYVGGWSASGVVAYEVAQQLMAAGDEVSLLALFDVRNPLRPQQQRKEERREARRQKVRYLAKELSEVNLRDLPGYVSDKLTELKRKVRQSSWTIGVVTNGGDALQAAATRYRPRPYPGRMAFFGAASRPEGAAWDFSQGWRDVAGNRFEAHEIPGDHRSIFFEPNVASLAEKLKRYFMGAAGLATTLISAAV